MPRQPRRGRTRDYNIPVRLNQVIPPAGAQVAGHGQTQQLASIVGAKRLIPCLLASIIVIIASTQVERSLCDNQLNRASRSDVATGKSMLATKQPSSKLPAGSATKKGSAIDDTNSSSSSRKHRERLLALLSENIERQHLKMAASIGVGLQRPSKFDSGEDIQQVIGLSTGGVGAKKSHNIADDTLKDIMRMHETKPKTGQGSLHYYSEQANTDSQTAGTEVAAPKLLIGSPKMVTQLVSHIISPLVGAAKQSDGHQTTGLRNLSLAHLRPNRPFFTAFIGKSPTPGASVAPVSAKPSLSLPNWMQSGRQSAYSTRPSTMFGEESSNWIMSSAASDQSKGDLMADSSSMQQDVATADAIRGPHSSSRQNRGNKEPPNQWADHEATNGKPRGASLRPPLVGRWLKKNANQMAQSYLQDSFRGLLTLSQLPILPVGPVSTAPSVLEPRPAQQRRRGFGAHRQQGTNHQPAAQSSGSYSSSSPSPSPSSSSSSPTSDKNGSPDRRAKALEDLYRYAYIVGTSMVGRKRDPLKALSTKTRLPAVRPSKQVGSGQLFTRRSIGQLAADNRRQIINLVKALQQALFGASGGRIKQPTANARGVMWDMATDPTLVVTLFHLLERASVALPLGFLLMPIVQMIRNPLNGINLGRVLPPRALHRSVEHELLAKRLDAVDKVLSRALRSTHRESFAG